MEIHSWCCAWLCKFTPTWCWPRVFTRLQRVLVKSATCPLRSRVLRLTEVSSLRPDSPWMSPRNETVKVSNVKRQMIVASYPKEWPTGKWCRTWWNHSWHSHLKRHFAFIRPRIPLVYRYNVIVCLVANANAIPVASVSVLPAFPFHIVLWCRNGVLPRNFAGVCGSGFQSDTIG